MKSLTILKALSDESRLSIFRLLLEKDTYSEVISERLKLAPSTVSFHLKKLSEAGLITSVRDQYYTIYSAKPELAEMTLKRLVLEAGVQLKEQDKEEDLFKEKTLKSFFKYGKLVKIPTQKMKREWVLQKVAQSFEKNKSYTPNEAQSVLAEMYAADPGLLLKELKIHGLIKVKGA